MNFTRHAARTPAVDASLVRARFVLMSAYAANGLLFSTWFSRLPALADRLRVSDGQLGMVMVALTLSTLVAIPLAARNLPRWRATRIVRVASPLTALAMLVAVTSTQIWQLAVALLLLGTVNGIQGVGLNAHATNLSQLAQRTWMPAMLGSASAAGVLGAGAGTIATAAGVPLLLHLGIVSFACLVTGLAVSSQVPIGGGVSSVRIVRAAARNTAHKLERRRRIAPTRRRQLNASRFTIKRPQRYAEPDRVLRMLIGAGLGATIAEGALANFGIVLFRDVLGASVGAATMAFTLFSIAMAIIRLAGGWVTDKVGPRMTMAIGGAITAVCGFVLTLRPTIGVGFTALAGVAVGIGCAVPVTIQLATAHTRTKAAAAGQDEERAAAKALSKLGLATSGGYLSGGPLVGLVASAIGLSSAVLIVAAGGVALAACSATLSKWEAQAEARRAALAAHPAGSAEGFGLAS
jgi:MFS family permease